MRTVTIGNGAVRTSAVGFGCVSLTTHPDERDAVRVLERALDAGITHFDVARLYGVGRAEGILGRFLAGKRDRVTVTTKFGLEPAVASAGGRRLVGIAKRLLRHVPAIERRAKARVASRSRAGAYSAADAERNLAISLRELRTDHVDVLLLHEGALADAANDELLRTLERFVAEGKVRALGVGTNFATLQPDAHALPPQYSVLQFDSSALHDNVRALGADASRSYVTHSAVAPARVLAAALRERPDIARELGAVADVDAADESALGTMLLRYALSANQRGVVLFATMRAERVTANAGQAEREPYDERTMAEIRRLVAVATGESMAPTTSAAAAPPAASRRGT